MRLRIGVEDGKELGDRHWLNDYQNMSPLNYAQRDSESLRDFFLNELQLDQVELFVPEASDVLSLPVIDYDDGPPLLAQQAMAIWLLFWSVGLNIPF